MTINWLVVLLRAAAIALVGVALHGSHGSSGAQVPDRVFVTTIDGAIGVATERQLTRAIASTRAGEGQALVIILDTPGGLVSSTREMIQAMTASPVPIIVYVSPTGARAASAGTFILYASHVAAMAPGTNLGAATPVSIGGMPGLPGQEPPDQKQPEGDPAGSAPERKAINDAVALLRSLAQLRGRDENFAEQAVLAAATLTADEALKSRVIEFVSADLAQLLVQVDGREVKLPDTTRVLSTSSAGIVELETDWRTRLLAVITDPNIAFILLMVGFYGLVLEFWNPGALIPGVVGAISLILALTALAALPVHYGALALLLLGMALMIAEAFAPGVGVLGIGGVVAFVFGAIFLFEGAASDFRIGVSWPVIAGAALTTAALAFGVVAAAVKARRAPPVTGAEEIIGMKGEVVEWSGTSGRVLVHGEIWAASSEKTLVAGSAVRVKSRTGLTLIVDT
jgi:membrane-bound serine protease (ClpP class)